MKRARPQANGRIPVGDRSPARASAAPRRLPAAATTLALAALACGPAAAGEDHGTARVLLSREGTGFVRTVGSGPTLPSAGPEVGASGVPLEAVSGLRLRVEWVELRRVPGDVSSPASRRPPDGAAGPGAPPADDLHAPRGPSGDGAAEWVEVELRRRGPVDLMSLPVAGGIELARGAVPPGVYDRLRLSVSEPRLVLNRDVAVPGGTLARGEHPLVVPGEAVGMDVVIGTFRVAERGRARLVIEFLEGHSAATITPTAGGLLMRPVLTPGSLVHL